MFGRPETVLSGNESQFDSKLFSVGCQEMGIANVLTSTCYTTKNGKTERFNQSILSMLRCYLRDHKRDWDEYFMVITYVYNTSIH